MKISKQIYFLSRNRQKMKFLSKKKFNGHVVPSPKYGMCCSNFEGALLGQKLPVFAMKK